MSQFLGQLFFNLAGARPAGWSETYHLISTTYSEAQADLGNLLDDRLAMTTSSVTCVYARVSDEAIRGDSLLLPRLFPLAGTFAGKTFQEPVSLLLREEATALYRASRWVHGLPFSNFSATDASYQPDPAWLVFYGEYRDRLIATTRLRVKDKTNPARPIIFPSVTAVQQVGVRGRKQGRPFGLQRGRVLIS